MVRVHDTHKILIKKKGLTMNEVLFDIYNDAYYAALNSGATEEEAMQYAETYKENVSSYFEEFYV